MPAKTTRSGGRRTETARPDGAARVFLLLGADQPRKRAEVEALAAQFADPDFADFDAEVLDGAGATAERILSAVATVPLGSRCKVVTVRDTQQMDPEEQKRLAAGLGALPASGRLLLHTGTPVLEEGKVKRGSAPATELVNAVKKCGEAREFSPPRTDDLRAALMQMARRLGKTLAPEALTVLAQLPADDVLRVESELQKAALYAGDAPTVTGQDVEATLSRSPDDVIFRLCDAVGARRTAEALGHVTTLFQSGSRPESVAPRTLVMLARQIRLIAQFRFLASRRMAGRGAAAPTPEALSLLPGDGAGAIAANPRTAWMADKYVAQARHFTADELEERLEMLLRADLSLKGIEPGGDNPQALIQRLVVALCERGAA